MICLKEYIFINELNQKLWKTFNQSNLIYSKLILMKYLNVIITRKVEWHFPDKWIKKNKFKNRQAPSIVWLLCFNLTSFGLDKQVTRKSPAVILVVCLLSNSSPSPRVRVGVDFFQSQQKEEEQQEQEHAGPSSS